MILSSCAFEFEKKKQQTKIDPGTHTKKWEC